MDPVVVLKTFMSGVVAAVQMSFEEETAAVSAMLKTYTEFQEAPLTPGQLHTWLIRNARRIMLQAATVIDEADAVEARSVQETEDWIASQKAIEESLRL